MIMPGRIWVAGIAINVKLLAVLEEIRLGPIPIVTEEGLRPSPLSQGAPPHYVLIETEDTACVPWASTRLLRRLYCCFACSGPPLLSAPIFCPAPYRPPIPRL